MESSSHQLELVQNASRDARKCVSNVQP
jgi:hypothetical protein